MKYCKCIYNFEFSFDFRVKSRCFMPCCNYPNYEIVKSIHVLVELVITACELGIFGELLLVPHDRCTTVLSYYYIIIYSIIVYI